MGILRLAGRGKGGLQVVQKILDSRLIPELMELNHPDEDPQAHDIKIALRGVSP